MIASLPMYDRPTTVAANDRYWKAIREDIGDGPDRLTRDHDLFAQWLAPDLVFSQTCGLPFRARLHDKVTYVGTPDFGLRGCPPGYYRSVIVVRKDEPRSRLADFAGATCARNDALSQSGWAALLGHLEMDDATGFFGAVRDTGAHGRSAEAVASGAADIAAIDAVTWLLLKRETDVAGQLRVIARTRPTPGLPYITARGRDPERLFEASGRALERLSGHDRARLLIKGVVRIPVDAYLAEPIPAREN
ncbi:PhnD/SsuA/transferrin family substrate-binding protein [Sulfitobacter sp. D35]|uniref:phosphate/phosphite/phosphonate ABC transporter substrate-binding protein n=1 Tax=Sulfitobacter sp. D35 TaxID=3083252 RepID=UPI00296FC4B6|nr:PhnD/SsuA/transferrin family substrate-binding protein [Sulfitobacter sp. D35]MDW4499628.1 PhnD/SsuA/transferrin family substrate-binding protein [Sulfitobacter sp. D35]